MRKIPQFLSFAVTLMTLSSTVLSAENACLLEGTAAVVGATITKNLTDCIQIQVQDSKPMEPVHKTVCNMISNAAGMVEGVPAKITYMAACPKPSQASCSSDAMATYYYKRSKNLLDEAKVKCENKGDKWTWH